MATHSSVLAWRIPGTGGLVGCGLWGRTELDTTEVMQQQHFSLVRKKVSPGIHRPGLFFLIYRCKLLSIINTT